MARRRLSLSPRRSLVENSSPGLGVDRNERAELNNQNRLRRSFRQAIREAKRRNNPLQALRIEQEARRAGANLSGITSRSENLAKAQGAVQAKRSLIDRFNNQSQLAGSRQPNDTRPSGGGLPVDESDNQNPDGLIVDNRASDALFETPSGQVDKGFTFTQSEVDALRRHKIKQGEKPLPGDTVFEDAEEKEKKDAVSFKNGDPLKASKLGGRSLFKGRRRL